MVEEKPDEGDKTQVLYRRYRPQTFREVAGQEHVKTTLLNAARAGRVAHAYLFCGPRGTGKTSMGRILAKAVNCLAPQDGEPCDRCEMCVAIRTGTSLDLVEIDAASNRKIEDARDLREWVKFAPISARAKVYIIDEVHQLTKEASNALLKTLEEPPPHAVFVLATTEPEDVLETIRSRCQRFDFRRLSHKEVVTRLEQVSAEEHISVEPQALELIGRTSGGSLRDALNVLQQLAAYGGAGTTVTLAEVRALLGITGDERVQRLARAMLCGDLGEALALVSAVEADGIDLRRFSQELLEFLRLALLVKSGAIAPGEEHEALEDAKTLAAEASLPGLARALKLLGQLDWRFESYSPLPLELALVDFHLDRQAGEQPSEAVPAPVGPARKKPEGVTREAPAMETRSSEESQLRASATEPATEGEELALPQLGTFEDLERQWAMVLKAAPASLRKRQWVVPLLRSCKPVAMEGDVVVLGAPAVFHSDKLMERENREPTEALLSQALGRRVTIDCRVTARGGGHIVQKLVARGAVIEDERDPGGSNE